MRSRPERPPLRSRPAVPTKPFRPFADKRRLVVETLATIQDAMVPPRECATADAQRFSFMKKALRDQAGHDYNF